MVFINEVKTTSSINIKCKYKSLSKLQVYYVILPIYSLLGTTIIVTSILCYTTIYSALGTTIIVTSILCYTTIYSLLSTTISYVQLQEIQ